MSKVNITFKDESGSNLNQYIATNVVTKEETTFELRRNATIPSGSEGTPLNAEYMNALKNAINNNDDNIIALQNRASNSETEVNNLKTRVSTTENNISSLDNRVSTNNENITGLQNRIGITENNISALQKTTGTANSNISTLQKTVNAHSQSINNLESTKANKNEMQQALDQKVNKSDIGEIPSIEGLASENYVKNYVNGAIDDFYTNEIDGSYLSTSGGVVNGNITSNNYTSKQSVCTKWVQCGGYMQYGTVPATTPTTKGALYFDEAGTIHYFKNAIVEGKTSKNELATIEYVDNNKTYVHHLKLELRTSFEDTASAVAYFTLFTKDNTKISTIQQLYSVFNEKGISVSGTTTNIQASGYCKIATDYALLLCITRIKLANYAYKDKEIHMDFEIFSSSSKPETMTNRIVTSVSDEWVEEVL